jgi:uncharacterized protein involved in outer membrane biogenesis
MKIRKLIIISPLGLMLLVGVVVAWFLADDAWIKGKIEGTVSEMTGRSLSIEGGFSLDWSSNPVLIAEKIHFANPAWAREQDLAKIDKLEVSIELFSILNKPIKINYIAIDGLVVALEENESGDNSWEMLPGQEDPDAASEEPSEEPASEELPVSVGHITLTDFTLLHEVPDRMVPLDFHLEQLELTQRADQQIQFSTDGRFGGEQFDLAGNLGPLNALVTGGKTRHDIELTLGDIVLKSQGSIEQTSTLSGANIKLAFSGPEFEWILTQLALPQFSHGDFNFNLDLKTVGDLTRLDLAGDLGSLEARAQGSFTDLAGSGVADLVADVSGDDLGSLFELVGVPDVPRNPFNLKVDVSYAPGLYELQTLLLEAGENSVSISGQLGDWPALKGTNLVFSLNGPDLSAWSPILQMSDLPASAFALDGEVSTTAAGLGLNAVRLELGGSYFVVNGTMGEAPEFTGTQLSIDAAGPSLANFQFLPGLPKVPDLPFHINGNIGLEDSGLAFDNLNLKLGDNSLQLSGLLGLNDQLMGSDLQTRMNLPSLAKLGPLLGVEGLPDNSLSMNGNYQRIPGGWAFQVSEGSFAGASFESEGKYIETDGRQQVEATSHVIAPSLEQLAGIAGVENLPDQPIDIQGFARYDAGQIEVRDMQGKLGDTQFKLSAKVMNSPTWTGSEITISASGPDIGQLLVNRDTERTLPFSVDGSVAREERNFRLNRVRARLGELQASANGILGDLENPSVTDLQLAVTAPGLQSIGEFFDLPLPDEPFSLNTRFQGSPSVFRAEALKLKLGSSDLSGDLSVDLEGKPEVNGVFKSNYLDLTWLQNDTGDENTKEKPKEKSKQAYLIPDTPIAKPRLDFADIDIDIKVNKIDLLHRTIRDNHVHARVKNGNLYLDPFQVRGQDGGLLSGNIAVEHAEGSDITSIVLAFAGDGVKLGVGSFEGQDPDTIREADIVANLSGKGLTYRDLARSLNGRIEVVQGAGLTEVSGLGLIFGNFVTELLSMINPFAKTEKYTVNECGVTVVNIESGVITLDPMVSQTEKMTVVAEGVVDLHTEKIQFTFNTKLRKGIGISASMVVNPFVSITGTLQSPVIGLDPAAVAVQGTLAVATVGISLLVKSLSDRYLSSKDPCGDALKKARKQLESSGKKGKKEK